MRESRNPCSAGTNAADAANPPFNIHEYRTRAALHTLPHMLALRKTRPAFGLEWEEVPEPPAPSGADVLLQVAAVGICGSDVHIFQWTDGYEHLARHLPVTLGHEFCARVRAAGPLVDSVKVGDLVAVLPGVQCRRCGPCLRGEAAYFCRNHRGIGTTRDGAFTSLVTVPAANCLVLPRNLDPALGALMEPLCIGDSAVMEGEVRFGDTVLVLGPGTIGQSIARASSWRGAARVIVVGLNDWPRLETALQVGATHVIDLATTPDLERAFMAITGGEPADVVLEATGQPGSIAQGLALLRKRGILVIAGIHAEPASIDVTGLVRRRQQLRGAHSSPRRSWETVARRIVDAPQDVWPMVSVQLPMRQALDGFARCMERTVSKVVLVPQD